MASGLQQPPGEQDILRRLSGPESRDVREAWASGDRDPGRVAWLLARHVFGLPETDAWTVVVSVARRWPGQVDPHFLERARAGGAYPGSDRYGSPPPAPPEPFGESLVPFVLIGCGVACVWILSEILLADDR